MNNTENRKQKTENRVLLSHGAGGKEMATLIERVFLNCYGPPDYAGDDSATLELGAHRLAFTTDSFVVDPLFFPGGDIGRLAVAGTVNDLLTAAARPLVLSASFIIEEGLEIEVLSRIAASMEETAREAGVAIVTGDTKVVPKGAADKVFITTAGLGLVLKEGVSGAAVRPGDAILLTGSVGDHGAAVMLAREKLLEGASMESDAAPLTELVINLLQAGVDVHAMRDPTRGGVAAALNEIARQSRVSMEIQEDQVPVKPAVAAVCEALGLDAFQVANEGKMLIFVAPQDALKALALAQQSPYGREARIIGEVGSGLPGRVTVRTVIGTARILDPPMGELLPRIC
ncbi:MAG: hydrogenase expression/formation protein HypE [Deltaproteobacteria bacterium]|nr:hydrogenase expression/formation protein HypE [Deltaproteobacteria bacterium]